MKLQSKKRALITGIAGQDGSYLAELLLHKDYDVYGIVRRSSDYRKNIYRLQHISHQLTIYEGDITDPFFVHQTISEVYPDEVYNLAAQSHVHTSFGVPAYTFQVNTLGLLNILTAEEAPGFRTYQASTSEMFGGNDGSVSYNEFSDFNPRSPYAVSKMSAHHLAEMYRQQGYFVSSGILFNHESPRRGDNFVTKKIVDAAVSAALGIPYELRLGNLNACRDWGFAPDYVYAMWCMLQESDPDVYVIGTGESHSVAEFLECASEYVGREIVYRISDDLLRPLEVPYLRANVDRANTKLGFKSYTNMYKLVQLMIDRGMDVEGNDIIGLGKKHFDKFYSPIFSWV